MAVIETQPWDVVDYLKTDEDQEEYLDLVLESIREEGGPEFVALALVDIARARGILDLLETELERHKEAVAASAS